MTNGFCLIGSGKETKEYKGRLALIDGHECSSVSSFIQALADQFDFPDYYSDNLDSLEEILNDLGWIEESQFGIVIWNYKTFLMDEDQNRKNSVLELLNDTAGQWENVPNYPGEEEFRTKAAFHIYVEKTTKVVQDLDRLKIVYQEMPS